MIANQAEGRERLSRLQGFLRTDPKNPNLLHEAAEVAMQSGELKQARALLEAALTAHPGDVSFRFQLGTLSLAEGRHADAEAIFEGLWKGGEKHPAVRYNLAYAQVQGDRFAQVREVLDTLSGADWDAVPGAHKLYAHACHHLEEPAKGIPHLEQVLKQDDQDAEAWGLLAMLRFDSDRYDDLTSAAQRALKLNPDEPNALLALGSLHVEQREPDAALPHLQKLVKLHPETGRAWSALAFAHLSRVELPAATQAFEQATRLMADDPMTWYGQGWAQFLNGELEAARRGFETALKLEPKFNDAQLGLKTVAELKAQAGGDVRALRETIAKHQGQLRERVAHALKHGAPRK